MGAREGTDLKQLELDIEEILSRKKVCDFLFVLVALLAQLVTFLPCYDDIIRTLITGYAH